jgi:hypothetical protein
MSESPTLSEGYRYVDPEAVNDLHDGTDIPGDPISRATLTMRCGDDVLVLAAPAALRVDPLTPRSHRNEGDEPVEMWAVSPWMARSDSTKLPEFWDACPNAERRRR